MLRMSLRIKLTEFIDTEYEAEIVELINTYYSKLKYPFKLKLWYEKEELDQEKVIQFIKRWEPSWEDKYKTIFKSNSSQGIDDLTWFNIVPRLDATTAYKYTFEYIQKDGDIQSLIRGINEFYNTALFVTSPKPPKRIQKRND